MPDYSQFGQVIDDSDDANYRHLNNVLQSQANVSNLVGQQASQIADPFQKYKPQVAESLSKLLSNPGDITTSPYYQFARDQGIEAVTRANKGVNSGKYLSDLTKFGTGLAGQQFGSLASLYNNILGGSGVGAGQMLMGGFGRGQDQQALAAAGRAAGAPGRSGGGQPGFDINALLSRYGINNQGPGQYNGSSILSSFTGPGARANPMFGYGGGSALPTGGRGGDDFWERLAGIQYNQNQNIVGGITGDGFSAENYFGNPGGGADGGAMDMGVGLGFLPTLTPSDDWWGTNEER